jgi:pimeloyl-ACP methyl ester carboxylesterase
MLAAAEKGQAERTNDRQVDKMPNCKTYFYEQDDGMSIEYWQYGEDDGYPLLYMHGATPMPFSDELARVIDVNHIRLLTILRPGYGRSSRLKYKSVYRYVKTITGFLSFLQLDCFDVLGVSAGAPYAYAFAVQYPEKVRRVHICGGIPLVCDRDIFKMNPASERFMFSLSKYLPAAFLGRYAVSAMEAMERKTGWQPHQSGESMDAIFDSYVRPNWYGIGWSTHVQYRQWGFDAGQIATPVHIYHSKADKMVPYTIAEASAARLKCCQLHSYEKEDHYSEKMIGDVIQNTNTATSME